MAPSTSKSRWELRGPTWPQSGPVGSSCPHREAEPSSRPAPACPSLELTVHTAVCRMASKPPSGASRLPEIRSSCSLFRNSSTSWVSLMTFLKEKGGSLLGQGSFSLGRGRRGTESQGKKAPHSLLCPPSLGRHPLDSFQPEGVEPLGGEEEAGCLARTPAHSVTHFSGLMSV